MVTISLYFLPKKDTHSEVLQLLWLKHPKSKWSYALYMLSSIWIKASYPLCTVGFLLLLTTYLDQLGHHLCDRFKLFFGLISLAPNPLCNWQMGCTRTGQSNIKQCNKQHNCTEQWIVLQMISTMLLCTPPLWWVFRNDSKNATTDCFSSWPSSPFVCWPKLLQRTSKAKDWNCLRKEIS